MAWEFLPYHLMAGHSAATAEFFAICATIAIIGWLVVVVSVIMWDLASAGSGLILAFIGGCVATIIWATSLSHGSTAHAQLVFQNAMPLLVCRNFLLAVALLLAVMFGRVIDSIMWSRNGQKHVRVPAGDIALGAFFALAAAGVVIGSLAFAY